jgi:hypothetical protein
MSNNYANKPIYSKDVCSLMRRINALEANYDLNSYTIAWHNHPFLFTSGTIFIKRYGNYIFGGNGSEVAIFDLSGNGLTGWDTGGSYGGIDVYGDLVYALGPYSTCDINVYDFDGNLQSTIGPRTALPTDVFVYEDEIYYCNYGYGGAYGYDAGVHVYDLSGVLQRYWNNDDSWGSPRRIFVHDDRVYLSCANTEGYTIRITDLSGNYIGEVLFSILIPFPCFVTDDKLYTVSASGFCVWELDGTLLRITYNDDSYYHPWHDIAVDGSSIYITGTNYLGKFSKDSCEQTTWYGYQDATKESLGAPNGGVSVPADNALCTAFSGQGADLVWAHIYDMRHAIEIMLFANNSDRHFKNPATGNPYNWQYDDPDNLWYVAMGDRTKYGATGGALYTWTRVYDWGGAPTDATVYDIDIGEIYECVATLEAAS